MQTLAEKVWRHNPPYGLFDETVVHNLFPDLSDGARKAIVHRSVKSGEILRLKPGLYCLSEDFRLPRPHPFILAAMLRSPSFVSMESSLWYHQFIPEATFQVSSVCSGRSRIFKTPVGVFSFFHVTTRPLKAGVRAEKLEKEAWAFVALPLRAIADMVFLNKDVTWKKQGMSYLLENLRIERNDLKNIQLDSFQEIFNSFRSRRVRNYLSGLAGELGK